MSNSSIWPIDGTLSSATTPGQNEPESNSNEKVLHIPQSSSITEASPSDCLVSYLVHSLVVGVGVGVVGSYPSAEMWSVYSTAPANWAKTIQFSISTQFSSIWPIDRTLSSATTLSQNEPESNGNEKVLHIPQSSSITEASPSDCLVSYLVHLLVVVVVVGGLTLLQRCGRCILQSQPTGQKQFRLA